jgi:hypothetical protein
MMTSFDAAFDSYAYNYDELPRRRRSLYEPKTQRGTKVVRQRRIALIAPESQADVSDNFRRRLDKSLPPASSKQFAPYFAKLDQLVSDKTLLVEGADSPSSAAIARARLMLRQFEVEALEPTKVVASVEGGVGICFVDGDKYADIECFNSGEILGVVSNRQDRPNIWKVEPSAIGFAEAAARIRTFLGATTRAHDAGR